MVDVSIPMKIIGGPKKPSPSGRQIELRHGGQRLTVVEVGGGIRDYRVGDRPVLDGFDVDVPCSWGRGQLLLPWPNRIEDGKYSVDGEMRQLALTEPERRNAIHGLTRWSSWRLDQLGPTQALAEFTLHPQPGYPYILRCRAGYILDDNGLTVHMGITNLSEAPAPVGMGAHPYLAANGDIADASLLLPANTMLLTNERGIPNGVEQVAGGEYDFRNARKIGATALDTAFTGLTPDQDGITRTVLTSADDVRTTLWTDRAWSFLQVFTGDGMPADRRRRSVAVEPMTCAPNAFRNGEGVVMLPNNETLAGAWGISVA